MPVGGMLRMDHPGTCRMTSRAADLRPLAVVGSGQFGLTRGGRRLGPPALSFAQSSPTLDYGAVAPEHGAGGRGMVSGEVDPALASAEWPARMARKEGCWCDDQLTPWTTRPSPHTRRSSSNSPIAAWGAAHRGRDRPIRAGGVVAAETTRKAWAALHAGTLRLSNRGVSRLSPDRRVEEGPGVTSLTSSARRCGGPFACVGNSVRIQPAVGLPKAMARAGVHVASLRRPRCPNWCLGRNPTCASTSSPTRWARGTRTTSLAMRPRIHPPLIRCLR